MLSLSYLFIFCVAIFERNAFASIEINEDTEIIEKKRIEGCIECGDYR